MSKYIDADKIIAELEKRIMKHKNNLKKDNTLIFEAMLKGSLGAYESIERFISSLQREKEWSEEDELMRERCIVDLGYLTEYEPQYKERYDAQINWLKSLLHPFNKRKVKQIKNKEK